MATQAAPGLQVQDRPAVGSGPSAGLPPQERGQHDAAFSRAITALGTRATEQRHQLAKMLDRVEHLESHVARQAGEIMGVRGGQRLHSRVIAHVRQSLASMQAHAATATPEEPSAAATAPLDAPSEPSATAAPQQTPEPTATAAGAPSAAPSRAQPLTCGGVATASTPLQEGLPRREEGASQACRICLGSSSCPLPQLPGGVCCHQGRSKGCFPCHHWHAADSQLRRHEANFA